MNDQPTPTPPAPAAGSGRLVTRTIPDLSSIGFFTRRLRRQWKRFIGRLIWCRSDRDSNRAARRLRVSPNTGSAT